MQAPDSGETLSNMGQSFGDALSHVLSEVCGKTWKTRVSDQVAPTPLIADNAIFFKIALTGTLEGEAILALRKADLTELRQKGARDAEDEAKLLGSALEDATSTWSQSFCQHEPAMIQVQIVADMGTSKDQIIELVGESDDTTTSISFFLFFSPRLISSVQGASAKTLAYPVAAPSANLDLVLDVELNVTLRFGQRQLSLREVLDLTSGSVVELDRQVDEPVELVLDGRVVARGEAVIVDGVYGMRVTQVTQSIIA